MIDLHCHILPGVDDGANSMKDSLEMAKKAVDEGIDTIVATPHHANRMYENPRMHILEKVEELNHYLGIEGLPLKVLPGQEIRLTGEMMEQMDLDELLPVNESSGYVFVELPPEQVPTYTKQMLYDLQLAGYKPVIVHPERNKRFLKQPDLLYHFVNNGAFTQVTAGSVLGKFGKDVQKFSFQMMEASLTHLIASDAHDTKKRGFFLKDAYEKLRKMYGPNIVYQLMENAQYVLDGEMVYSDPPERIKSKKLLGIFG
ncbi:tyrosine-protein phosphatase [Thalassobacillus hwangdonensis]|uniref:Tyrosine-protein phosphatase n=1 Tax=Thalassobacillus hwangdonensis TaxID=546108 RepID=A0ABW3L555_9BACI